MYHRDIPYKCSVIQIHFVDAKITKDFFDHKDKLGCLEKSKNWFFFDCVVCVYNRVI